MTTPKKDEETHVPPPPLPPSLPHAVGPLMRNRLSEADGSDVDADPRPDFTILDRLIGRLWKPSLFAEPILALEILDGPYKGIVFSFASFTLMPNQTDGMVPTRYETEVHVVPRELKDTFRKDEGFDAFTTEILIAWLGYIHTNSLEPLIKVPTRGVH